MHMPTIRRFLPIDPSWYSPGDHLLRVPEGPIVKSYSRVWGFLLWVFGQAVFLHLEGSGSHRTIYVSKRRVQEFLGSSASKEHIGRQFAEKIYMLAQRCRRGSLPEGVNSIRREAEKTKESLQQLPDRDIQEDIRELIENIQSNACRLLQEQGEEEIRQAIVDTALLELRAMAIEVSALCARDRSSFQLPALSQEAKEWHQRVMSALLARDSAEGVKTLLEEGFRKGFLNQKSHLSVGGSILHTLAKREWSSYFRAINSMPIATQHLFFWPRCSQLQNILHDLFANMFHKLDHVVDVVKGRKRIERELGSFEQMLQIAS